MAVLCQARLKLDHDSLEGPRICGTQWHEVRAPVGTFSDSSYIS